MVRAILHGRHFWFSPWATVFSILLSSVSIASQPDFALALSKQPDLASSTQPSNLPSDTTDTVQHILVDGLGMMGACALGVFAGWQATRRAASRGNTVALAPVNSKASSLSWQFAVDTQRELAQQGQTPSDLRTHVSLTLGLADMLCAEWQISAEHRADAIGQGGQKQMLRIHDVTGLDRDRHLAHSTQQYECKPKSHELHILISRRNRDYVAELGFITIDEQWLSLAHSGCIHVADGGVVSPASEAAQPAANCRLSAALDRI